MPTIRQRCALLKREAPVVVAQVLAQAIPLASAGEVEPFGQQLVKMGRGGALASILGDPRSAQALKKPLQDCPGSLLAWAARRLVADKNTAGAIETIQVLEARATDGRTEAGDLYALAALLELNHSEINLLADRLLVGLAYEASVAKRSREVPPAKMASKNARQFVFDSELLKALARVIEARITDTRSRGPQPVGLAAALLALVPHSPIANLMSAADHPVLIAARRAIGDIKDPMVSRHLLLWMEYEPLAGSARRWIADALMDPHAIHFVLEAGHLLRRSQVRHRLRAMSGGARCIPSLTTVAQWPLSSKRAMPHLIQALQLGQARRIEALCDLIVMDDVRARCCAVIALSCYQDKRATEALVHFCMDVHPAVVRAATSALQTRSLKRDDLVRLAQRSSGKIAAWARQQLAGARAEDLMAFWGHLTVDERCQAALDLRQQSEAEFSLAIDGLLLDGDRWTVVGALQLLRQMGLTEQFSSRLIELSAVTDTRIASTAVACLGDHPNPRTVSVITARLSHCDDRVQANAVEALGQVYRLFPGRLSPQQIGRVISPLTLQSGNRTRANAIVVLAEFYPELAAHRLQAMLRDANPLFRASAIWAARECQCAAAVPDLSRMAKTEETTILKQRATEALQALTGTPKVEATSSPMKEQPHQGHHVSASTVGALGQVIERHTDV